VRVDDLRIGDDPAYADGDFLQAASAQVSVRVLPALFGRWEVRRVTLRQPAITLIRDANGLNVDSLGRRRGKRKRPPQAAQPPRPPRQVPLVVIGLLDVRNGELRWIDRRVEPPTEIALHDLHVAAEDLSARTPADLTIEGRLAGAARRNLKLTGTVGPVGDPPVVDVLPVDATLSLDGIDAALLRALPDVAPLVPRQLRVDGPIDLHGRASGTMAALTIDGTVDAGAAAVAWGDDVAKATGVACTATATGRREGDVLSFEKVTVQLAGATANATGRCTLGEPLQLDVAVEASASDLAAVAAVVPALAGLAGAADATLKVRGDVAAGRVPAVSGTVALRDVALRLPEAPVGITGLTTTIQLEGDGAVMPSSRFLVDGRPMEASVTLHDFDAPYGELHVTGDAIPLTVFGTMPVKGLPPDVVRAVSVDAKGRLVDGKPEGHATIRSASGTAHGADYTNLTAAVHVQDEIATLESFALEAYGGTVQGSGRADLHDRDRPKLSVETTARGVGLEGVVASQKPKDMQRVSGRLDADASLAATGRTWDALQRTVSGAGRVEVRDGVIYDINIGDDVLGGLTIPGVANLLPQKLRTKRPVLFSTGDTRFDSLRASAVIANETARTDDVVLSAKAFTVRGGGTLTMDGRVDFKGTFIAAKGLTADILGSIKEAKFLTNDIGVIELPFVLRGKLPKIKAQPDLSIVTKLLDNGIIQKGLDAVLDDKKRDSTEKKIKRGLDKLFGH
jgi:uncharacterized protein involved in outer membrane biogenesis